MRFEIPPGTTIPANGYVVFTELQLGFALNGENGDQVYLSEGDGTGAMTGGRSFVEFGPVENAVGFGRDPNGSGHLYRMKKRTPGGPNNQAQVGPVVINELMYNAPAPIAGIPDVNELEYIELCNTGYVPEDLWIDYGAAGNFSWQITGGADFEFPVGTSIDSQGYLLLVRFDPVAEPAKLAAFQSHYGVPAGVPVLGPYVGGLNDYSETLRLRRPDVPNDVEQPGVFVAPMVIHDELTYFDWNEWPVEPDGTGPSLERVNPKDVAREPTNWKASLAVAGTAGRANSVKSIPGLSTLARYLVISVLAMLGSYGAKRRAVAA
jgi:hypothetical protein